MSGGEHWGGACTCAPLGRHVVGPRDVRSGFSGSAFTEAPAAAHRAPFDIPDFDVIVPHGGGRGTARRAKPCSRSALPTLPEQRWEDRS